MDNVKFLKKLTKDQLEDLACELGLPYRTNGFRCGFSVKILKNIGMVQGESWDHDYSSSADYDDEYITFNDHEVLRGPGDSSIIVETLKHMPGYKQAHAEYLINKAYQKRVELNEKTAKERQQVEALEQEAQQWLAEDDLTV